MKHILNKLALVVLTFVLLSGGCDEKTDTTTTNNQTPPTMTKPFEFSSYDDSWKKVDSLENQGRPKSALEIVNAIMDRAEKDQNQPMQVKALMYQLKFNQELEENEFVLALNRIDEMRKKNVEPLRQILASVKAQMLWSYMQNNRYYFYNRTQTQNFDLGDVTTWDLKTLIDESNKLFMESVQNAPQLQQIDLKEYKYILTDRSAEAYNTVPTLYDFLANIALNHFRNEETGITRPAAKFAVNDERFFASDPVFLSISTETQDTLSQHLHYVKIMRELVRFHSGNKYPIARMRNELNRLSFAYQTTTLGGKTEWYKAALLRMQKEFSGYPVVGEVNAQLASLYVDLGNVAQPATPEYDLLVTAYNLCTETIHKYPNTYGANKCRVVKQNIEYKALNGNIEQYNSSNQSILVQADFKNLDSIHVVIYQARESEETTYYYDLKERLKGLKMVSSTKIALPVAKDFHSHTTEFPLQPMGYGNYLVLLSTNPSNLEEGKALHWVAEFQVTDLVYSLRGLGDNQSGLQVVDRTTGNAIAKSTVKVYESEYNYTTRKNTKKLIGTYTADANGWATIPHIGKGYSSRSIEVINGKDKLFASASLYQNDTGNKTYSNDHLFTDRAIYRPGQTVYFKGIRLETLNKSSKIVSGKKVKATLKDVNYQDVSSLDLTSNEYGSYSGSFRLPTTGLTGQMHIQTDHGTVYFSVEEYKRPTFKTEFAKSTDTYKLDEHIKVEGNAIAYAGNAVDKASVKYVVKRGIRLPYWRAYYLRIAPISSAEVIIAEGTVSTDEQGKFTIDFKAEKDVTHHAAYTYTYTIEADVTDMNGETRSATKYITVSESALQLSVSIQESIDKSKKNNLSVSTTNSEWQSVPAKGTVVISRLKSNDKVTRSRNWVSPDKPLLSEIEFKKLFPHLEYKPVDKLARAIEKEVATFNFDTEKSTNIELNTANWSTGDYKIETTTKDKNNVEVKDVQFVTVTDANATKAPFETVLHAYALKSTYEPGETITVPVSSSLQNQLVLAEINVDGKIVERKHLVMNGDQKSISFKVEEQHRGGLSIHVSSVKFGKEYSQALQFTVPYSNKDLQVSFETFRNKLLPGETEEWRLRITGPKKEKVAAEMLLTMYDASLDAFKAHNYSFNPFIQNASASYRTFTGFGNSYGRTHATNTEWYSLDEIDIPDLNWFGYYVYSRGYGAGSGRGSIAFSNSYAEEDQMIEKVTIANRSVSEEKASKKYKNVEQEAAPSSAVTYHWDSGDGNGTVTRGNSDENAPVPLRSNFNETAFFFPQLKTDANGDILVSFTVPESLTSWKVLGLAHTKDLEYALVQNEVVTQKELMVQTNAPRFIRSGDEVVLTAKVSNLTENVLNGTANIQLFDALTMQEVSSVFQLVTSSQSFSSEAKQSSVVSWKIKAPENINSLVIRVTAKAQNHTDGEELTVPVLTDKVLVTESMPMTNNGKGAKDFVFTKLVNSKESGTLTHHSVTLEYTSNPAWYVIQALPYMLEYPYDCSEQIFTRFYANAIASNIVRSSPKIKEVFDQWKNSSPDAFLSNLEKNQQLKSVILEETPWVLQAKDQSERKKRVALLFDFNKMDNELASNLNKLRDAQVSNGGFPWFPGMRESQYVTQYIVSGMGHLNQLGIVAVKENKDVQKMIQKAVKYLDARMLEDYNDLKKRKVLTNEFFISQSQIQYFYARSFFTDIKLSSNEEEAFKFFKENAEKHWLKLNLNNQTMFALTSHRNGNTVLAEKIMNSVIERSITTEEMGMYWKENERGYYWYQAPIETQALIIEALSTIKKDQKAINNAKIWLLRNKQTSDWKTTTATANAAYALLIGGSTFTQQSGNVKIEINGKEIKPEDFGAQAEAGTGYFQKTWTGKEISADLGKVKVTRNDDGFSWGAMYWQYFESMDKVTSAETNLKLKKQLFVVRQTGSGEVIVPIKDGDKLKRGEKVRVRIELATDRNMEFVHMKDFRAAGFEPINVLSRYKWQGGLGYYENTRDVATHFFLDYLPKGNYVFEYDLRVSHSGDFSNGFATIQCMYAPEFTSHSNGVRVKVE